MSESHEHLLELYNRVTAVIEDINKNYSMYFCPKDLRMLLNQTRRSLLEEMRKGPPEGGCRDVEDEESEGE